jgi:uncharacterized protein (DUF2384 family)
MAQAARKFGSRAAAEEWVFTPKEELDDLTPAEAIRYREIATGVSRLLDSSELSSGADVNPKDRHLPYLIEGGRRTGSD